MNERKYLKAIADRFLLAFPIVSVTGAGIIVALGILLFFTQSSLVMTILSWIGIVSLFVAVIVLLLKYSGFFTMVGISNPTRVPVVNVTWVLTMWAVLVAGFVGTYSARHGVAQITAFTESMQDFIKEFQDFIKEFKEKCPWW